jgi:hypothetical protein
MRDARARLTEFRAALEAHPTQARTFLAEVPAGPLKFTPQKNRYRIAGEVSAVTALYFKNAEDSVPKGIRTPVPGMKTLCPGPG